MSFDAWDTQGEEHVRGMVCGQGAGAFDERASLLCGGTAERGDDDDRAYSLGGRVRPRQRRAHVRAYRGVEVVQQDQRWMPPIEAAHRAVVGGDVGQQRAYQEDLGSGQRPAVWREVARQVEQALQVVALELEVGAEAFTPPGDGSIVPAGRP